MRIRIVVPYFNPISISVIVRILCSKPFSSFNFTKTKDTTRMNWCYRPK